MQTKLRNRHRWRTRVEPSTEIFDWIEVFYKPVPRRRSLGMHSRMNFEKREHHLATGD